MFMNSIKLLKSYKTVKLAKRKRTILKANGAVSTQDYTVWQADTIVLELIALIKEGEVFNSQVFLEGVKYITVVVRQSRPISLQLT